MNRIHQYSNEELNTIYELGRLFFETGYFAPAERIFNGLASVDEFRTPARLGLGLVKLERGLFDEATSHLRLVLEEGSYEQQAKIALCAAFVASGDIVRGQSILAEIQKALEGGERLEPETQKLYEAYVLRCRVGR